MFWKVKICITITTNEKKTKRGENDVEQLVVLSVVGVDVGDFALVVPPVVGADVGGFPLVVSSVVGVDIGGLQDSAVVSIVCPSTGFTHRFLVAT